MNNTVIILVNNISDNNREDEVDVLHQAEIVSESLYELGYDPVTIPFSLNIEEFIKKIKVINPKFIFNLFESIDGKSVFLHIAPSILELYNIPYTGFSTENLLITTNKVITKTYLKYLNLPTAKSFNIKYIKCLEKNKKYIYKPISEEGSVGIDENNIFIFNDKSFEQLKHLNNKFYIEEYIDGREINVPIVGSNNDFEILSISEIKFNNYPTNKSKIVCYKSKWKEDSFEYNNTIRTFLFNKEDENLINKIKEISSKCWKEMNLSGYARIDFRIDQNNNPYILEINGNPCISKDSGYYGSIINSGYTFNQIINKIINILN
jgi:D-alanine-D-alanine ligase